jgi:uncharacterized membrane protein YedE/YeeE
MEKNINTVLETNTDFEVRSLDAVCVNESKLEHRWWHNLKYLLAGMFFGLVLIKAEVVSWYRIQEMFRFQSFHMYGILGSAVAVGMLSVYLIRRFNIKTIYGEKIEIHLKPFNKGQVIGGLLFGSGWALTGACPGPLYALIGAGVWPMIIVLLSAIAGTWVYGCFREKLPH